MLLPVFGLFKHYPFPECIWQPLQWKELAFFAGGSDVSTSYAIVDIFNASSGQWTNNTLSIARNYLAGEI